MLGATSEVEGSTQACVVHPDDCIDCEACVSACPANAIYHEDNLPPDWFPFRDLNATMARQCPTITEQRAS
ncbi:MAG: ferredoxin family protein [Pirellulales bacterium]|nr:ferredoxin family protein [Pirellulales bacterium]